MKVLIEAHYLPRISYFKAISAGQTLLIEAFENFQKQSFRNRCQIISVNKPKEQLVIPVSLKKGKDIKLAQFDPSQKWSSEHMNSIKSAYGKAPYFEYYWPELEYIFKNRGENLLDFNINIIKYCLKCLQFDHQVALTGSHIEEYDHTVLDYRWIFDKKQKLPQVSVPEYRQVFGKEFESDLSIIDLIFSCGPQSGEIIRGTNFTLANKSNGNGV